MVVRQRPNRYCSRIYGHSSLRSRSPRRSEIPQTPYPWVEPLQPPEVYVARCLAVGQSMLMLLPLLHHRCHTPMAREREGRVRSLDPL